MKRRTAARACLPIVVFGGLAALSAQQPAVPPQQAPPVFKAAVDLVAVDVSVIDGGGRPVRGLDAADFQVTVDGQVRRITSVQFVSQSIEAAAPRLPEPDLPRFSSNEGATGGRLVMIVVDQGNMNRSTGMEFKNTVAKLLARLGPADRAGLAVLPGSIEVDFTRHFALVSEALGRVVGGGGGFEKQNRVGLAEALAVERDPRLLEDIVRRECQVRAQDMDAERTLEACRQSLRAEVNQVLTETRVQTENSMTALRNLLRRLQPIPGPKTLVYITEGLVIDRDIGLVSWAGEETAAAQASIYAIRVVPPDTDVTERRASETRLFDRDLAALGLEALVGMTRGSLQTTFGRAEGAIDRLALELTGYYLVGFEPESSDRDGKAHQIAVRVGRPGVTVRARRQFIAPVATAAKTDEDLIKDALRQPLPASDVPLSVATHAYKDPASERIKVLVSAAVGDGRDLILPRALGFWVSNEKGDVVQLTLDVPAPGQSRYLGAALVAPGIYNLKFAALDEQGRLGSVEHRFDARLRTGGPFRYGELMLADGTLDGALQPKIEPVVTGDSLKAYTELYATDAARFEGASIRFEVAAGPNAEALTSAEGLLTETASPGRQTARAEVPLASLPRGEYVLRAVISVSGRPVARLTKPFSRLGRPAQ
ncbi:MAG: VWA domain-containing protein [Vicinamibacterales bacterium]